MALTEGYRAGMLTAAAIALAASLLALVLIPRRRPGGDGPAPVTEPVTESVSEPVTGPVTGPVTP